ncbi:MAG TPA: hypothetical protein VJN89_13140 [Candidatus Acidoferrum sp.]|nr:hypothetical protein [Candidatus Acidoferrum sp.]
MGVFLYFGAAMASLAGVTLVWRGTFLDRAWALNPGAYNQLSPLGETGGIAFLLLGITLAVAGTGWLFHRFWGWVLTVIIIATQVLANLVNAARGDFLRGGTGFLFSSALLYFLFRPRIRAVFARLPLGNTN